MKRNKRLTFTLTAAVLGLSMSMSMGAAAAGAGNQQTQGQAQKAEKVVVTDPTAITKLNSTSVPPLIVEAEKDIFTPWAAARVRPMFSKSTANNTAICPMTSEPAQS
ncbi:hypothetical protein VQ056_10815 [Paenibacillus sp. JTLBN-2024]